jgi:hypothetical protein
MSESKHTAGPWHQDGHNLSAIIRCTVPRGHPDAKHTCGDYETVARCEGDNWAANARLIASAPDLLEALEWIASMAEVRAADDKQVFTRVNRGALRNIAARARAALAKAEGR